MKTLGVLFARQCFAIFIYLQTPVQSSMPHTIKRVESFPTALKSSNTDETTWGYEEVRGSICSAVFRDIHLFAEVRAEFHAAYDKACRKLSDGTHIIEHGLNHVGV